MTKHGNRLSVFWGKEIRNDDRQNSGRKLILENLEERQLLSASTLAEAIAITDLASNAGVFAQQESALAPIDLSNAVTDETETPSLVVTTDADVVDSTDGLISLREAISYAKNNPSLGNTITFAPEITSVTRVIQGRYHIDFSINIGDDSTNVTINAGSGYHRIFEIDSGASVTINGVSVNGAKLKTGADVDSNYGAAIYVHDANTSLTLKNATLSNNQAYGGAAIAVKARDGGAALHISNVKFIGNDATNGAAVNIMQGKSTSKPNTAEFQNVLIVGNTANKGAVHCEEYTTTTFRNVTVANNTLKSSGNSNAAGLYFDRYSTLNMYNSLVVNNGANNIKFDRIDGQARNSAFTHMNDTSNSTYFGGNGGSFRNNITFTSNIDGSDVKTTVGNYLTNNQATVLTSDYELNYAGLSENAKYFIDAGDNQYVTSEMTTDIDGRARKVNYLYLVNDAKVDLGAYELQHIETPSIIVTTTEDVVDPYDNMISLREAVEVYFELATRDFDATVDSAGQTVTFRLTTPGEVKLGGSEVTISDSMTIYGGTRVAITISGDNASRIFKVADSVESVAFQGLKFTNGKAYAFVDSYESGAAYDETLEAYNGGAIYATTSAITVKDSDFMLNSGYIGGAIFVDGGTLAIDDTSFAHNESAYQGGAVAVYGAGSTDAALDVAGSIFDSNASDRAGAVYFKDGVATIDESRFLENEAKYANGGAITVANATLTATDVELTNNEAERFGGAIFAGTSNVTINNGDGIAISGNAAQYGGAIYASKGTVNVESGAFSNNTATYSGGAIYSGGALTVSGSFTGNESGENGGAINANDDLTAADATFENNVATGAGGAIFATKGDVSVSDSAFTGNSSTSSGGGAVRLAKVGAATFENATFTSNESAVAGGAINASATTSLTLDGGTFTGNSATNSGGAIYATGTVVNSANAEYDGNETQKFGAAIAVVNGSELLVEGGTFKNGAASAGGAIYAADSEATITADILNNTSTTYGGGIYAVSTDISVHDSQLIGNVATSSGGAIFTSKGSTKVAFTDLADNAATSGFGGAIYATSSGDTLTIQGGAVSGNTAANSGGAIYAYHTDVVIEVAVDENSEETTTRFDGNESQKFGGAIYVVSAGADVDQATFVYNAAETGGAIYAGGNVTLTDATFTSNSASNWGGAIYMKSGVANFTGVEFSANEAAANGGAVYLHTATATLTNATFSENTAAVYGGAIDQVNGSLTISSSTFAKNVAQNAGGAIYQLHGTSSISGVSFTENAATKKAGAIYVGAGASTISGSTFSGNVAPRGTAIAAISATTLEIDGEAFPETGAIEEEDLSTALLDEAFAELFFEELD